MRQDACFPSIGVSKFTRETAVQMTLFEDPKIEYYQEWDRKYDSGKKEDPRLAAYEKMGKANANSH